MAAFQPGTSPIGQRRTIVRLQPSFRAAGRQRIPCRPLGEKPVDPDNVRRLNKKPIILIGGVGVTVLAVMAYGLATRGPAEGVSAESSVDRAPASDLAREINASAPKDTLVAGQPVPPPLANIDPAASPTPQPVPGQGAAPAAMSSEPSAPRPLTPAQEYNRERQQAYYQDLLRAQQARRQATIDAIGGPTRIRLDAEDDGDNGAADRAAQLARLAAPQAALPSSVPAQPTCIAAWTIVFFGDNMVVFAD